MKRTTLAALLFCLVGLPCVHAQERQIFWTDASRGKILRGDDGGTTHEVILAMRIPHMIAIADEHLYWADAINHAIQRSSLEGDSTALLLSGLGTVADLTVDAVNAKIYWIEFEGDKIWRANLDGTETVAVQEGLLATSAIAIDSLAGKLYWASKMMEATWQIQRANLDGTQAEHVLAAPGIVVSLAIDAVHGKLYWISRGTNEVKRAGVNGQNMETVIAGVTPSDLALDPRNGKLYLADFQSIVRANLDGTHLEELVTNLSFGVPSLALHLTEERMYWIDGYRSAIQRANLDGSQAEDILVGFAWPRGLALDVEEEHVYWTGFGEILRAKFDGSAVEYVVNVACGIGELSDIAIDSKANKMYWLHDTDCGGGTHIRRANLDGSEVQTLLAGGYILALALDLSADKLYWADAGGRMPSRAIYRASLDGSDMETLIDSLNAPTSIAIDSKGRKMYWIDFPGTIKRSHLDGAGIETVLTGLNTPVEIAIDSDNGKMYWTERDAGKIRRANIDGTDIEEVFTGLNTPYRIALTFENPALQIDERAGTPPPAFSVSQNYPNPFNPETTIEYSLPKASFVKLVIYDMLGQEVRTLVKEFQQSGVRSVIWDGKNNQGKPAPNGIYIYRIAADGFVQSSKAVLLK